MPEGRPAWRGPCGSSDVSLEQILSETFLGGSRIALKGVDRAWHGYETLLLCRRHCQGALDDSRNPMSGARQL